MPFTIITQGSFVSQGIGIKIPIPQSADAFRTINITQLPLTPTPGVVVRSEWFNGIFNQNNGIRWTKTAGTSAINMDTFATTTASGGFTYVTAVPFTEPQAAAAITSITQAAQAIVSQVNTYSSGDVVRLYNTTGMLQIAGMPFQISSVSGAGYTLIGLNSSGFAFPATAGNTRRLSPQEAVDPQFLYITGISQALQAVVTTSVDPAQFYVPGMLIYFSVPGSFGMKEINGLTGKIVAVDATPGTYTLTIDIDTTGFTAFAFPTSASVPTTQLFATLGPAGARTQFNPITNVQTGYDFQVQPFRTAQFTPYMFLSGGAQSPAGANGDTIVWQALKSETGITQLDI